MHGWAWYSGGSVGRDGTVYGWGVTDVSTYTMVHFAYASTTLTSPVKKRQAASGMRSAQNSVRADVFLAFDPGDLGTYVVQTENEAYCCLCECWLLRCWTEAAPVLRMTQWAALRSVDNTPDPICNCARTTRYYQGLDAYGWIPNAEWWVLNESFTAKNSSCVNGPVIDESNNEDVGFEDVIETGCSNPGCVFETNQTFSVALVQGEVLTQVPGVECVGMTDTQCLAVVSGGTHKGWHTKVTNTSVTVTDN